jgi:hypothetical protein
MIYKNDQNQINISPSLFTQIKKKNYFNPDYALEMRKPTPYLF